ncbi:MAG: dihydroorotase [Candidatus Zhuqueibacterota bacterium]
MKKKLTKSHVSFEQRDRAALVPAQKVLIRNAKIIGGQQKANTLFDILIVDGKIAELKPGLELSHDFGGQIIDATGLLVFPGFMDLHVHFREPGREDEETIRSGAAAAMAGGFTAACTMPNTQPVTDNKEIVEYIQDQVKNHLVKIYPIAAITRGQKGEEIVDIAELIDAGVVAFSDDGRSVANSLVLRRAMEYARMFDVPIIEHCEDSNLAAGGAMHEGYMSTKLGMPGIPAIAEDIVVARNIMLAEYLQCKIHIAHVSTAGAVELIRRAKEKGIQVTAEVTPHHFTLTDETIGTFDANYKMNPPLRDSFHIDALIRGLKDGAIDAIATDHAPHSAEEKEAEFEIAPFGIIGLETAVGLVTTQLVGTGQLTWDQVAEKMSLNPCSIVGVDAPAIRVGETANLTIIDPEKKWMVDKSAFKSRSQNSPFIGRELKGKPVLVFNQGYYYSNDRT